MRSRRGQDGSMVGPAFGDKVWDTLVVISLAARNGQLATLRGRAVARVTRPFGGRGGKHRLDGKRLGIGAGTRHGRRMPLMPDRIIESRGTKRHLPCQAGPPQSLRMEQRTMTSLSPFPLPDTDDVRQTAGRKRGVKHIIHLSGGHRLQRTVASTQQPTTSSFFSLSSFLFHCSPLPLFLLLTLPGTARVTCHPTVAPLSAFNF